MAKINHFIAQYTDSISELIFPDTEGKPPKAVIHRFVRLLKKIDDSRVPAMIDYPLEKIVLIAFLTRRNYSTSKKIMPMQ